MEGDGRIGEFVGGYSDWLRQRRAASAVGAVMPVKAAAPVAASPGPPKRKLSFKDARELEQLPVRIETLEAALERSEEHTSELQSLMRISYAVFCLNKKKHEHKEHIPTVHNRHTH